MNWSLEKYSGLKSRHTCPSCGQKRCFTLYVNDEGEQLNPAVGRCDHESACGYHYTPAQYFSDHPEAKDNWRDNFMTVPIRQPQRKPTPKPLCFIPSDLVTRSVNPKYQSAFTHFLASLLGPNNTRKLVEEYRLGITRSGDVIFFQIDIKGRCRTGKVMKYDPQTGHRINDENIGGRVNWIHSMMKRNNALPQDWELTQCLFGEHLLPMCPGRTVALVESEKTAVICSALMPEYVWLATGGKSQLGDKLNVLRQRTVIAFPDVDGYELWKNKASEMPALRITVSDLLEKTATPAEREAHIDIADRLIAQLRDGTLVPPADCPTEEAESSHYGTPLENPDFLQIAQYISPEHQGLVTVLMDDLGLVPIDVRPVSQE
jgi:hypothetical protein